MRENIAFLEDMKTARGYPFTRGVLRKQSYFYPNKVVDVNDCWLIFDDDITQENWQDEAYWFDRVAYAFVKYKDIPKNDGRFIPCIHFSADGLYRYYEEKIGKPEVTAFFENQPTLEEKYLAFRAFADWNKLDTSYDRYLIVTQMLVKWCIQNEIAYHFRKMPPPSDYIYNDDWYKTRNWAIY